MRKLYGKAVTLPLLLMLVFSAVTVGCGPQAKPGEIAAVTKDHKIPISHPLQIAPLDLILVIDQSGTMSGAGGIPATDPDEWRVSAAHYLTVNLGAKMFGEKVPRIGVVNFGTDALPEHSIPLADLDSAANIKQITRNLQAMHLGWTNFSAAFREVGRLFEEGRTFELGRKAAVVLFTDGEPIDLRRLSVDEYFQEINAIVATTFGDKKVDLFVVGIDAVDASWLAYQDRWHRLLPTEASRVFHLKSMDELPRIYNDIVRILYEIPDVPPEIITDAQRLDFELPAYLEWVEFHVFREDKDISLNIVRPDGKAVQIGDKDVTVHEFETFSIVIVQAPAPGRWQYWISDGRGRVEVYRNMIPVRLRLKSPRPLEPLGREQKIVAEFFRQDGMPLSVHPDFPIQVEMTVTDPAGGKENILLTQAEPGIYTSAYSFLPKMEGTYLIRLDVFAAGAFSYTGEYTVEVAALPYLVAVHPSDGSMLRAGTEQVVEVAVFVAGEPVDPAEYFLTPPTSLVIAWLEPKTEQRSSAHYLHPTGQKGRLAGLLPYPVPKGEGQVRFRIVGTMQNGQKYRADDLVVTYRGVVPGWIYGLYVLAALALFGGVIGTLTYLRRPAWRGRLIFQDSRTGEEKEISLSRFGKKRILTLGNGAIIHLDDNRFPQLSGTLRLERRLTPEGMKNVPVLTYRMERSDHPETEELIQDGYVVIVGSFTVSYYSF